MGLFYGSLARFGAFGACGLFVAVLGLYAFFFGFFGAFLGLAGCLLLCWGFMPFWGFRAFVLRA